MDIIKKETDLGEGTSEVFTLKEEPVTDIKYEEHYDAISPAVFVSEDKVSCICLFKMPFRLDERLIRIIVIPILMFHSDACEE
jgi:hypothetical protein